MRINSKYQSSGVFWCYIRQKLHLTTYEGGHSRMVYSVHCDLHLLIDGLYIIWWARRSADTIWGNVRNLLHYFFCCYFHKGVSTYVGKVSAWTKEFCASCNFMNLAHEHTEARGKGETGNNPAYEQLVYWLLGANKIKRSSSLICANDAGLTRFNTRLEG